MPTTLSSPVAVQASSTELEPRDATRRSVMSPAGMLSGSEAASATFKRPPDTQRPASPVRGSAKRMSRDFTSLVLMPGKRPMSSAAAPVTCGAAMLVPESRR